MRARKQRPEQLSKLSGTWRTRGKGPHDDPEVRLGYGLKHAPANARYKSDVHLREIRVTEVEDGWRVMFKGDRGKRPVIAYVFAETYAIAVVLAVTSLDIGILAWYHDDYPPKRYDKPTGRLRF